MTRTLSNRKPRAGLGAKTHLGNMVFLLPTAILFTIVVLIPVFQGIPYSFTSWKSIVSDNHPFNGLANYKYLLGNKYFLMSLKVTFSFTILYMTLSIIFGFGLALLIQKASSFNNVSRTIFRLFGRKTFGFDGQKTQNRTSIRTENGGSTACLIIM